MHRQTVSMTIDGRPVTAEVEARLLLIQALRDEFRVTGPHVGCQTGRCGACTVLVNGEAVKSCLMLAVQANGVDVTTAAGLAKDGELHPLQQAFHEHHALQCGFCTPGMLCAALDLLTDNPRPTEGEIRDGLRGNLCRCTGYQHIVEAVAEAAVAMASAPQRV